MGDELPELLGAVVAFIVALAAALLPILRRRRKGGKRGRLRFYFSLRPPPELNGEEVEIVRDDDTKRGKRP